MAEWLKRGALADAKVAADRAVRETVERDEADIRAPGESSVTGRFVVTYKISPAPPSFPSASFPS